MNEEWRPVRGWEELYEVSNMGRVRSKDRWTRNNNGPIRKRGQLITAVTASHGYLVINLCLNGSKRTTYVHRLVAEHFLPPSEFKQVNHLDFDRSNNNVSNLEWVSCRGNMEHAISGGKRHAITNPRYARKLSRNAVDEIRALRIAGETCKAIGRRFGVGHQTISNITTNKAWRHPS